MNINFLHFSLQDYFAAEAVATDENPREKWQSMLENPGTRGMFPFLAGILLNADELIEDLLQLSILWVDESLRQARDISMPLKEQVQKLLNRYNRANLARLRGDYEEALLHLGTFCAEECSGKAREFLTLLEQRAQQLDYHYREAHRAHQRHYCSEVESHLFSIQDLAVELMRPILEELLGYTLHNVIATSAKSKLHFCRNYMAEAEQILDPLKQQAEELQRRSNETRDAYHEQMYSLNQRVDFEAIEPHLLSIRSIVQLITRQVIQISIHHEEYSKPRGSYQVVESRLQNVGFSVKDMDALNLLGAIYYGYASEMITRQDDVFRRRFPWYANEQGTFYQIVTMKNVLPEEVIDVVTREAGCPAFLISQFLQIAAACFEAAIKAHPRHTQWQYNNLANVYDDMGNTNKAMEYYQKAVELQPSYTEAQRNRGVAFKKVGRYVEAYRSFKQALAQKPPRKYAAVIFNDLGSLFAEIGYRRNAVAYLEQAVEANPEDEFVRQNLRQAQTGLRMFGDVRDAYQGTGYTESALVRDRGNLAADAENVFVGGTFVFWRYDTDLAFKERIILLPPPNTTYYCNRLQLVNGVLYAAAADEVLKIKLAEAVPLQELAVSLQELAEATRENVDRRFPALSATTDRFIAAESVITFQHPDLRGAHGIAIEPKTNNVYISALSAERLFKFASTGELLWQRTLDWQPLDVVLDNTGAVWVTYGLKGKIQQYDAAGSLLKTYDFSDQFTTFGIDVAPDGTLWLSDFNGGLLVNLSSEGEILNSITGLQHPVDIAVAPNGAVYTYAGHPDGSEYPFILKFVPEGTSGEVFGVLPG